MSSKGFHRPRIDCKGGAIQSAVVSRLCMFLEKNKTEKKTISGCDLLHSTMQHIGGNPKASLLGSNQKTPENRIHEFLCSLLARQKEQ
jgi:hypothetical protein